jgi:alpha-beta hydrolase superfamily lysophospholipase
MTSTTNDREKRDYAILDQPDVSRVLFHPRRDVQYRTIPLRVRSLTIPVAEGISVSGRLYRANADGPVILFFHGNGEIASDYDGISPLFTSRGLNLLVVDYRGYGSSDGQPTASNLLADAIEVFQQSATIILEHGFRAQPLFVMGRSLGSAAAIEIAYRAGREPGGLIIESGFAYTFPLLTTLGLRTSLEGIDEASDGFGNLTKIAQIGTPTLIIHGREDQLIPIENAQALYEHSAADDKKLVTISKASHNDLLFMGQETYFDALKAFTERES